MSRYVRYVLSLVAIVVLPGVAGAATFDSFFNTGVDDSGALLPLQAVDPHYDLITSPDAVFTGPDAFVTDPIPSPPWIANGPNSQWITPRSDNFGEVVPGTYVYRTSFDNPGLIPSTVTVNGQWASDDGGFDVRINGASTGQTNGGFGGFTPFVINSNVNFGPNEVDFHITNGGGAPNPQGLRVEFLSATATDPLVNLSTGYAEGSSTYIAKGALDDDWVITAAPAGITLGPAKSVTKAGAWFGDEPFARWLSAQNAASGGSDIAAGSYTYETTFNLSRTGNLFRIGGVIGSDDTVTEVRLNGNVVVTNTGGFGSPAALPLINDQTLFLDGTNTLEVTINNAGVSANPHGFNLTAHVLDALSTAPVADADGPYTIDTGIANPLLLDATASFDLDAADGDSIVLYEWDLNNDSIFDFSTSSPTLNLSQAQYSPFYNSNGVFDLRLRVTDATNLTGTAFSTVTVVPESSSLCLFGIAMACLAGYRARGRFRLWT